MNIAITGAATGIGAATASMLGKRGHEIVAIDINEPANGIDWIEADLSTKSGVLSAVNNCKGRKFDALINCAGLPPREGLSAKILALNVLGLIDLTNALAPQINDSGTIINIASRAGNQWRENIDEVKALLSLDNPDQLDAFVKDRKIDPTRAYRLSKEAVIVWTMSQCENLLPRNIRINSVSPSAVETGILPDFMAAFGEQVERNVARVGRPGTADDIAQIVTFLTTPESSWINGQDIQTDGGMSAILESEALGLAK